MKEASKKACDKIWLKQAFEKLKYVKIVKEGTALDNGPGGIEQAEELGQSK